MRRHKRSLRVFLLVLMAVAAFSIQGVGSAGPRRYGIRFTGIEATPLEVVGVDEGSIAGNAGVKAGDRIVAMNGSPIAQLSEEQRVGALRGSPLVLRVERGKETIEIRMSLDDGSDGGRGSPSAGTKGPDSSPSAFAVARPDRAIAPGTIVVPFELFLNKPVVQVMIDDKGPFAMFLDTGAEGSVLDASLAAELNLPVVRDEGITSPGGQLIPGKVVRLNSVRVGGFEKKETSAVSMDRSVLYRGEPDAPRGVLSASAMFEGRLVTLDYPAERLVIAKGALPPADGREIFEYGSRERLPSLPVRIGGKEFLLHLDSGAPGGFTLPLDAAAGLSLVSPPKEIGRGRRVDRQIVIYGATLKGTATLGRYSFENPRLAFNDGIGERGLVGYEVLKDFAITLDRKNRRIRLQQ